MAKACPKLKEIRFFEGTGISDADIAALSKHCKELEFVDLRGKHPITERAIFSLACGCPKLKLLKLALPLVSGGLKHELLHVNGPKLEKLFADLKAELAFEPKTVLGRLYQAVIKKASGDAELCISDKSKECKQCDKDRERLAELEKIPLPEDEYELREEYLRLKDKCNWGTSISKLKSKRNEDLWKLIKVIMNELNYNSGHFVDALFDFIYRDSPQQGLFRLMRTFLSSSLDRLSEADRRAIYENLHRLSGSPETQDKILWGKQHCFDNHAVLAEALGEHFAAKDVPKKKFQLSSTLQVFMGPSRR